MPCSIKRVALFLALGLGVASGSNANAETPEALANRLAAMRSEVEALSSELTELKTDTGNQLRSIARQKADLEVELERERVRIAKLRSGLEKKQLAIAERGAGREDLVPIYTSALSALKAHVSAGLPFRRADRLAALEKIDEQRVSGVMSTERALSRLWSFVEDEFRMTRESGLYRQTIALAAGELLADVIRVGMVMMFFRTESGALGYTKATDKGWTYVESDGKDERRNLRALFDAFKKQIRVGFFHLPNALPAIGGGAR